MKQLVISIGVACALTAGAGAQGFSPESVRNFFRKSSPAKPAARAGDPTPNAVEEMLLVELWGKAMKFREMAVDHPKLDAWKRSDLVRTGALERLEGGKITQAYRELWSWVLMGSQVMAGNTMSDQPVVAFYNPFIDAALLTTWTHVDDKGWRMADAVPITGAAMVGRRGSRPGDRPGYGKAASGGLDEKLVGNSKRFVAAFESAYPAFGRSVRALPADAASVSAALSYVEDSSYTFIGWVRDAMNPKAKLNYVTLLRYFHSAWRDDSPEKLADLIEPNPISAESLFRIKQPVRARMLPYVVLPNLALFVDPHTADGFLSVQIGQNEAGTPAEADYVESVTYRSFSK